jgi:hypothetical protein
VCMVVALFPRSLLSSLLVGVGVSVSCAADPDLWDGTRGGEGSRRQFL